MNVMAQDPFYRYSSRTIYTLLAEQGVDVFVRDLRKRTRLNLPTGSPALFSSHIFEDFVHFGTGAFNAQPHQAERRASRMASVYRKAGLALDDR